MFSLERLYTLDKVFVSSPSLHRIGLSGSGELERRVSRRVKVYSLAFELPIYQSKLISIVSKLIRINFFVVVVSMFKSKLKFVS